MAIYLTKDGKTGLFDREGFAPDELERAAKLLEGRGFEEKYTRCYWDPSNNGGVVQLHSLFQVHVQEIGTRLLSELVQVLKPNYFHDDSIHEGTAFAPISEL